MSEDDLKRLKDLSRGSANAAIDPNLLSKLKQELDRREGHKAALQQLKKEVEDHSQQDDHDAKFSNTDTQGTLQALTQQIQQGVAQKPNIQQTERDAAEQKMIAEKLAKPEHQTGTV